MPCWPLGWCEGCSGWVETSAAWIRQNAEGVRLIQRVESAGKADNETVTYLEDHGGWKRFGCYMPTVSRHFDVDSF